MNGPRIGELFSGYGGLGMGVQAVLGGSVAWHSEIDPGASKILAHRYPDVPNHGDITKVNWASVEPVDVLTGGFPCQDVSAAGKRAGIRPDTRSGLWSQFAYAIDQLRPGLVVVENVRGLLSADAHHPAHSDLEPCPWCMGDAEQRPLRALGAVLGELADLGYDASWQGLRASDVGAPHGRFRVFVIAWPATDTGRLHGQRRTNPLGGSAGAWRPAGKPQRPAQAATDTADDGRERGRPSRHGRHGSADHGDAPAHTEGQRRGEGRTEPARVIGGSDDAVSGASAWGQYGDAIRRWERVIGRPAPAPTELTAKGTRRLSARAVEWMMGLPAGWVTDVPGLGRNQQLKALGNGVVWQQAAEALRILLPDVSTDMAGMDGAA